MNSDNPNAESTLVNPMTSSLSIKFITVMLLTAVLSACGFNLRGEYSIPDEITELSLTSFDKYNQLTRNVDAQLRLNDIAIVSPSSTVPNLHLLTESVSETTLSLYQNSKAAEKQLQYKTSYRVTIPGQESQTYSTSVTRSYLSNSNTALAKSVERDLIEDEMSLQAATQIMRQLARLNNQFDDEEPVSTQTTSSNE